MDNLNKSLEQLELETIEEIEAHFLIEDKKRQLEIILINYLKKYEKKQLRMNSIFVSIRVALEDEELISIRQFSQIIKFIEKELHFKTLSRKKVFAYFSPIINKKTKVTEDEKYNHFSTVVQTV